MPRKTPDDIIAAKVARIETLSENLKTERRQLRRKTKALAAQKDRAQEAARLLGTGAATPAEVVRFLKGDTRSGMDRAAEILALPDDQRRVALRGEIRRQPRSHWAGVMASTRVRQELAEAPAGGALLLNDTRTQANIGCVSTTEHLIEGLGASGLAVRHGVTLPELTLCASLLEAETGISPGPDNLEAFLEAFVSAPCFALYRELLTLCDSVVVNGEGSFYDAQSKGLSLLVLSLFAARQGRPVAIINHSAALQDATMAAWCQRCFAEVRSVVFREPLSCERLPEALRELPHVGVGSDAAFRAVADTATPGALRLGADLLLADMPAGDYVLLTGTSAIYRSDRSAYEGEAAFAELCHRLQADLGLTPVLWEAAAADAKLLRPIALEYGYPYVTCGIPRSTVLHLLGGARMIIGGRWHASILAASTGTPAILGDANFFKTEALARMLGQDWPMFSYRDLDPAAVIAAARQILTGGTALRARTRAAAEENAAQSEAGLSRAVAALRVRDGS